MDEINIQEIKHKTTANVVFLSFRNIGIQAIAIIGFFILSILLGTGEVGLFAIVAESVGILGYFSDIGLASALIQKREEITEKELRTTFLIQQLLVFLSLIVVAAIYPKISISRHYGPKEFWILISLCYAFAAASLKTIPSVLLERKLNFKIISTIDVIENASFYIIAVIFAFLNFGAYSYAIATFFRSTLGLILIYKKSPWSVGFAFCRESAKRLFKFGIPFQINSFIAMAKDKLSSLLVAGIIGREYFGILAWAQKGPRIPLNLMDAIMKVTFPTFARLQDHKEILKKSLERSIYFISFFVFPALAGIAFVAPDLINVIPKYTKWSPAIVPLYFYTFNAAIAAVTTPLTNAFNATGHIKLSTKFMIMWTILTWIFFPVLSIKFGYIGTAVATLVVGLSSFIVWYVAEKKFKFDIVKSIFHPLISTFFMVIVLLCFQSLKMPPLAYLIGKVIIGVLAYGFYHYLFSKKEITWFIDQIKQLLNHKK